LKLHEQGDRVDRPYGRGPALAGWCVAAIGVALILVSAVSSDRWNLALQVAGTALFAVGGTGFIASQLRT
jgi:hypothetical protein